MSERTAKRSLGKRYTREVDNEEAGSEPEKRNVGGAIEGLGREGSDKNCDDGASDASDSHPTVEKYGASGDDASDGDPSKSTDSATGATGSQAAAAAGGAVSPPSGKPTKGPGSRRGGRNARRDFKFHRQKNKVIKEARASLEAAKREREEADREVEEAKRRYEEAVKRRATATANVISAEAAAKKVELDLPLLWNNMFRKLAAHVMENGDCFTKFPSTSARREDPELDELCKWISAQRQNRSKMEAHHPDRIVELDKLGFVWDTKAELFRRKAVEMQAYIAEHGNLAIPFKYPANQQLATWVHNQRKEYKNFQLGLPSAMTQERIDMLESAGFEWTVATSRKRKRAADSMTEEEIWMDGYNKMVEFSQQNGHCRVNLPINNKRTPDALRDWATWQRKQYRLLGEGKPSLLTQERVDKLNDLGFVWESYYGSKKRDDV